jgi:hypothetical protein
MLARQAKTNRATKGITAMNAIQKLSTRTARLVGLMIATFAAALVIPAQSAFAQVAPPEVPIAGGNAPVAPVIITHTSSSSGLAVWLVVLIAIAAIAIGAGLRECVRALSRRQDRRPVTV